MGVHVEVRGAQGIYRASVQGHGQAQGVALSALAFLRALIGGEVDQAGIWGAEQIVPIDSFLKRLVAHGLIPTIRVIEPAARPSLSQILKRTKELNMDYNVDMRRITTPLVIGWTWLCENRKIW